MMNKTRKRIRVTDVNPNLICLLCSGYFIDATTLTECLHSFCKTCIVKYLESSKSCPVCDVVVHKTRPHLNIRSDKTLQDLVYKLVPGVYKNEMKRRRDFYSKNPLEAPSKVGEDRGDENAERLLYSEDDKFSLSLHFCSQGIKDEPTVRTLTLPEVGWNPKELAKDVLCQLAKDVRYLQCAAGVTIDILKRFIRIKYELPNNCMVDIFHTDESLRDDLTLMDVAYIYTWRRKQPLKLNFSVYEFIVKRRKKALVKGRRLLDLDNLVKHEPKTPTNAGADNSQHPGMGENHSLVKRGDQGPKSGSQHTDGMESKPEVKIVKPESTFVGSAGLLTSCAGESFKFSDDLSEKKAGESFKFSDDLSEKKAKTEPKPDVGVRPSPVDVAKTPEKKHNCKTEVDSSPEKQVKQAADCDKNIDCTCLKKEIESPKAAGAGNEAVSKSQSQTPIKALSVPGVSPPKKPRVVQSPVRGTPVHKQNVADIAPQPPTPIKSHASLNCSKLTLANKPVPGSSPTKAVSVCKNRATANSPKKVTVSNRRIPPGMPRALLPNGEVPVSSATKRTASGVAVGSGGSSFSGVQKVHASTSVNTSKALQSCASQVQHYSAPAMSEPGASATASGSSARKANVPQRPSTTTAKIACSSSAGGVAPASAISSKAGVSVSMPKPKPATGACSTAVPQQVSRPTAGTPKAACRPSSLGGSVPSAAAAAAGAASPAPAALAASSSPSPPMASSAASMKDVGDAATKVSLSVTSQQQASRLFAPAPKASSASNPAPSRSVVAVDATTIRVSSSSSSSLPSSLAVSSLPSSLAVSSSPAVSSPSVVLKKDSVVSASDVLSVSSVDSAKAAAKQLPFSSAPDSVRVTIGAAVHGSGSEVTKQNGAPAIVNVGPGSLDKQKVSQAMATRVAPVPTRPVISLSGRNGMPAVVTKPTRVNNAATSVNTLLPKVPTPTVARTVAPVQVSGVKPNEISDGLSGTAKLCEAPSLPSSTDKVIASPMNKPSPTKTTISSDELSSGVTLPAEQVEKQQPPSVTSDGQFHVTKVVPTVEAVEVLPEKPAASVDIKQSSQAASEHTVPPLKDSPSKSVESPEQRPTEKQQAMPREQPKPPMDKGAMGTLSPPKADVQDQTSSRMDKAALPAPPPLKRGPGRPPMDADQTAKPSPARKTATTPSGAGVSKSLPSSPLRTPTGAVKPTGSKVNGGGSSGSGHGASGKQGGRRAAFTPTSSGQGAGRHGAGTPVPQCLPPRGGGGGASTPVVPIQPQPQPGLPGNPSLVGLPFGLPLAMGHRPTDLQMQRLLQQASQQQQQYMEYQQQLQHTMQLHNMMRLIIQNSGPGGFPSALSPMSAAQVVSAPCGSSPAQQSFPQQSHAADGERIHAAAAAKSAAKKQHASSSPSSSSSSNGLKKSGEVSPKKKISDIANSLHMKVSQSLTSAPTVAKGDGPATGSDKHPPFAHSTSTATTSGAAKGDGIGSAVKAAGGAGAKSAASGPRSEDCEPLNLSMVRSDGEGGSAEKAEGIKSP